MAPQAVQLPVTVVAGSFGAGKTTVLKSLLRSGASRVAVVVNDVAEISFDLQQLRRHSAGLHFVASVQVVGGCICCTRREDFLEQISSLAARGDLDAILVEAAGVAEPLHIAENFKLVDDLVRLDTLAAVVDALEAAAELMDLDLLSKFNKAARASVMSKKTRTRPHGLFKPTTKLLVEQVTFANVVLLNKCDLVGESTLSELLAILRRLNPEAQVHECKDGQVAREAVVDTGLFSMQAAEGDGRWFAEADAASPEQRHLPLAEQVRAAADAARPQPCPKRQRRAPAYCRATGANGGLCADAWSCVDCNSGWSPPGIFAPPMGMRSGRAEGGA